MNTPPRYRSFRFGIGGVDVVPGRDGISLVKTRQPLDAYPARLTDKLIHWAKVDPDRTYMARRDKEGQWRRISYGQALQSARRIGQALLQRGPVGRASAADPLRERP
ncbi:hypothetical protein J2S30_002916 [Herbaspirillum rubrisubalbicans]|nr:hypothetical protein [Herbaspirillum rubrisubalbicans]